ncbi:hypothetical protein C7S18_03190 [Ahniella affigens]|uniref:Integrin n=1 Tax=Ahniella affigens TaxID=2021234 RepID=A0A2P1PN54_9GAMM|nr:FG-GAP repeat protein [Ahniella affigens]AVP96255.1 hypothetical protein C7S18_03190 [Ahniella affigens]
MFVIRTPSLLMLALGVISVAVNAATIANPATLPGGDGGAGDYFGSALALAGDTLVVGAPRDRPNGANSGSVYVFARDGDDWALQQRLVPSDNTSGDQFGFSVAIHGDLLIVGAPYVGGADQGGAYVFERSAGVFTEVQKFEVTPMPQPRYFGWSVAAGPNVVWVGSPAHRIVGNFQGSATQFAKDQNGAWIEGPTFGPFGGTGGETFGIAMAYSAGQLIVGEKGERVGNQDFAGAAIAYRYDGSLTQIGEVSISSAQSFDQFGAAVAISGPWMVIGAPATQRAGYAQVFHWNGTAWLPDGATLSRGDTGFGYAVAVDGDRLAISGLSGGGLVQLYQRVDGQWLALDLITPADLFNGDDFGAALALTDGEVMAGLPGRDLVGVSADVGEIRTLPFQTEIVHQDGFE